MPLVEIQIANCRLASRPCQSVWQYPIFCTQVAHNEEWVIVAWVGTT